MVFSSLTFLLYFLPLTLILYFLVRSRRAKNVVLLVSSLLFYAWGEPFYIVLIILSTLNDYLFSNLVARSRQYGNDKLARLYFIISVVVNLGLLGVFKYADFAISNINLLLGVQLPLAKLPLPIGISFYTFQTMSYSIDVYLGKVKAQKNLLTLATYVALFPQLIAGPIVRYITVEDELDNRRETLADISMGLKRFIIGLSKKVIIANQMGYIADQILNRDQLPNHTVVIWLAVIAYTFQIYFDFSGYSDMAIGLGRIFGFHFLENFNYPYIANSVTDFWRRWHISLSSWFRDYVYIPLGGNRHKQYRNIFIVWLLTGMWHGASWNYILWGLYYCLLLVFEKQTQLIPRLPKVIQHGYLLFIVMIGWTIFRIEDFTSLKTALVNMFVYTPIDVKSFVFDYQNLLYALPFIPLAIIASTPWAKGLYQRLESRAHQPIYGIANVFIVVLLIINIIFLVGSSFNPFIYFRF